jgi:hypothetical protein
MLRVITTFANSVVHKKSKFLLCQHKIRFVPDFIDRPSGSVNAITCDSFHAGRHLSRNWLIYDKGLRKKNEKPLFSQFIYLPAYFVFAEDLHTLYTLTFYPRKGSRGIPDIPPRHPRFTKMTSSSAY